MARRKTPTAGDREDASAQRASRRVERLGVLVVDYQALFRDGLRYLLRGLGEDVTLVEAESFAQAEAMVGKGAAVDLVLADVAAPEEDGFEGLRRLHRTLPEVPIVVVSTLEARADVRKAFDCGVRGYVPKSSPADVMLGALRLVLAGGVYLPPLLLAEAEAGPTPKPGLAESAQPKPLKPRLPALTPRQTEILEQLATGKSNREIARALGLAEGTVKVHVTAVLKALGVKNRTQAVLASVDLLRRRQA